MTNRLGRLPLLRSITLYMYRYLEKIVFIDSQIYWEQRYANDGTAGYGSTGRLADFKAEIINDFVRKRQISSIIEFGCGDGMQLSLADYPTYIGLDVSKTAIHICDNYFSSDKTKSFFLYDPLFLSFFQE